MRQLTAAGPALDLRVEVGQGVVVGHHEDVGRIRGDGRQLSLVYLVADPHRYHRHALLLQLFGLQHPHSSSSSTSRAV